MMAWLEKILKKKQPEKEQSPAQTIQVPELEDIPFDYDGSEDTVRLPDNIDLANIGPEENSVSCAMAQAASCTAIGTREYQQDAVRIQCSGQTLAGVLCDGMGGLTGGERASCLAADGMLGRLMRCDGDYPADMGRAAAVLNEQVKALKDEKNEPIEAGTTLTAAVMSNAKLYWCNIGDSRVYICRGGKMQQLSVDHNFGTALDQMVAEQKISAQEARSHPKRAALTSYLGIDELSMISGNLQPIPLQNGDVVVQCSDGLYRCLAETAIADILAEQNELAAAARTMVDTALKRPGGHDNTSVILMRYLGEEAEG